MCSNTATETPPCSTSGSTAMGEHGAEHLSVRGRFARARGLLLYLPSVIKTEMSNHAGKACYTSPGVHTALRNPFRKHQ